MSADEVARVFLPPKTDADVDQYSRLRARIDEVMAEQKCFAPAWCFSPLKRGFVMANALAAPVMLLVWAWVR